MANELDDRSAGSSRSQFRDGKPPPDGKEGQKDLAVRIAIALVALAAAIIFVAQNSNHVETTFLFFEGSPRLWIVILVCLVLGAALGQATALFHRRRKKP